MVGFTDLLKKTRSTVSVHGMDIYPLTVKKLGALCERFEELIPIIEGGKVDAAAIIKAAPKAIGALLAAGIGEFGNEKQEDDASDLPLEVQLDFLEGIINATFESGIDPFVERFKGLGKRAAKAESPARTAASVSPSPQPSSTSGRRVPIGVLTLPN